MAKVEATCGKTPVVYDSRCSYSCSCLPNAGCKWTVSCPDGAGGTFDTTGTGLTAAPPRRPSVTVAGDLETCAKMLEKVWKRRVVVPVNLRNKRIRRRTLTGTSEEMAHALGLELGPRR